MRDAVSAICLSHSSRYGLCQRAMLTFQEQSYPDKELLVVVNEPGYADTLRGFVAGRRLTNVRVLLMLFRTLAEGFLNAAAQALGSWLACWDDDDQSHPERLSCQLATSKDHASLLSKTGYLFYATDELFFTDFAQPSGALAERCAISSLALHRTCLPTIDTWSRDAWTDVVIRGLEKTGQYQFLDVPGLFIVGSTGNNRRGAEKHRRLAVLPGTLSRAQLLAKQEETQKLLKSFYFTDGAVEVSGRDAQAYRVTELRAWAPDLASPLAPEQWQLGLPTAELQQRLQAEKNA